MGYLEQLSPATQNLVLLNFEFFGKKFLLGIVLVVSLFYVFYWHKKKQETPYLFIGVLRSMFYLICWAMISIFPFFLFILTPQVELDLLIRYMAYFYSLAVVISGFIVVLNIYYFAGAILFRLGGINTDTRVKKVWDGTINSFLTGIGLKKVKLPNAIDFTSKLSLNSSKSGENNGR